MGSEDWPDWLPGDWTVHIKKAGSKKVKSYVDPDGHKCYSKPQVFDHLRKTGKSVPVENTVQQNGEDPGIDLSVEPNAPHTDEVPGFTPGGHPAKLTPRTTGRRSISVDTPEAFAAAFGQSSGPSSSQRHKGESSWLPAGWSVEEKFRKGGSSEGMKYKMYIDPVSGKKFFSKPQVLNYLAKTNRSAGGQEAVYAEPISATPISAWQEKPTTEPDSSQIYEDTEGENVTNKTAETPLSSGYDVISRTPVEDLPPGWIKELRMRKGGLTKKSDPYYLDPSSDYAFRSKKDALRYLESGDVTRCAMKPQKRHMNNDDTPNVNLTMNGGDMTPPSDQFKGTEASRESPNGPDEELKTNESGILNPKPVRSITGGSFPGSSFSSPKEENYDWLPDGWHVDVRSKASGAKYKIYRESATGKQLYSKPQVLSYLGIADTSKEHTSQNSTPAAGTSTKRSVKRKNKDEKDSDFQEVITTSAADGLPPGWIKENRVRIYASHKRNDPFYTDPVTGYIFRSKKDALRFLESGDVNICAIRPKVKDKDGNEVWVYNSDVKAPATGNDVSAKNPEENHTHDPTTADNANQRVTKNGTPPVNTPTRASKRQKGKNPEDDGAGQEKQETGVNLEKLPDDNGNLSFDIPDDENWADIDFAVKTLTNEIMLNGQPLAGEFQDENGGVETSGVKETPTKVN